MFLFIGFGTCTHYWQNYFWCQTDFLSISVHENALILWNTILKHGRNRKMKVFKTDIPADTLSEAIGSMGRIRNG